MEPYNANRDLESMNGRSVIPRRLPSVPSLPSLSTLAPSPTSSSSSPTPPSSIASMSPSSAGSSSPGSTPSDKSASQISPRARPLPQIPPSRHMSSLSQGQPRPGPGPQLVQLVVCRKCFGFITTSERLLPSSAVPPGTRAFRGFSGKASLFTEVYNVSASPPRMQLMTTGAHTMQETFCAKCSLCLGWKIVKAHERSERWKEGNWLLELENLWLMRSEDVVSSSLGKAGEWEVGTKKGVGKEPRGKESYFGAASKDYPKDAARMVRASRHQHSRSAPNFGGIGGYRGSASTTHLPMTCAS